MEGVKRGPVACWPPVGESVFWPDLQSDQLLSEHSQISGSGGERPGSFLEYSSAGTHTEELIFITEEMMDSDLCVYLEIKKKIETGM